MIGRTLSRYRILGRLGAGGMGEVYLGEDLRLGRKVALKLLAPEMAASPERRARFEREAKAVAALNHPNIVTIYSIEEAEDRHFITMELVEGRTLRELIPRPGGITLQTFLELSVPIADALHAAHQSGITHRDLKPSNIMVTTEGKVKILDFGLAKVNVEARSSAGDDSATLALTREGAVLGTVAYMSPEQLQAKPADPRSDIFSLGVVLYEMATSRRPFAGDTWADVVSSIIKDVPVPPSQLNPAFPPALDRIVGRCLEKDPEQRYQSALDVRVDLEGMRNTQGTGGLDSATLYQLGGAVRRPHPQPSIAVLPFTDMSPERDQQYFCDGIAEELINALTKVRGLRVASRTAAFALKGREQDLRRIRQALGVASLLEGSVRKAGNRLRVTVRLVDLDDGYDIWSERYDRDSGDIFAVQDEISLAIIEKLKVARAISDEGKLTKRYTENAEAYNLYLKGRFYWNRRYRGGMQKGMKHFQEAIDVDPSFALPYVGLADSYALLAFYNYLSPAQGFPKAKAAAGRALELDDTLAAAHTSLGLAATFFDWDWAEAERRFARALDLNPAYGTAHFWYGFHLLVTGRKPASLDALARAREAEPLSTMIQAVSSYVLYFNRQPEAGLEEALKTLEADPGFGLGYVFLGFNYVQKGHFEEAVSAWQEAIRLLEGLSTAEAMLAYSQARAGQITAATELFDKLKAETSTRYVTPYYLAAACLALERTDEAFEWLDRCHAERNNFLAFVNVDPLFDELRGDVRLAALTRKMGLPPA
jgi:TolB-like protein/predicted Ser/Thr protein kinase